MANDPLAVTQFDLHSLVTPTGPSRVADMHTFARPGDVSFADVWLAHLGGQAMAERHTRQALGPADKRANEQHIDLVTGTSTLVPAPDRGDVLAARLGLRTLIHHRARTKQRSLSADLWVALVRGLRIEPIWTRRNRTRNAVRTARTLQGRTNRGEPLMATDIVASVAGWQGTSKATTWNALAHVSSTNAAAGHASDPWFDSGKQDAVAAELGRMFRSGEAEQRTRWDLFNLVEGFYARGLVPTDYALKALDHALEMTETAALADVVRRDAFMVLAGYLAEHSTEPSMASMLDALAGFDDVPDSTTVWRWVRGPLSPLFSRAVDLIRRH